jgi:hypothetical protein
MMMMMMMMYVVRSMRDDNGFSPKAAQRCISSSAARMKNAIDTSAYSKNLL